MPEMKHGGARKGAGRKPGAKSLSTLAQKGELGARARVHSDTALDTLVRVAKTSTSDAAAVSAAMAILDRGYGRPFQSHEHTGKGGGPISMVNLKELTDDQLAALAPVIAQLAALESSDDDDASVADDS